MPSQSEELGKTNRGPAAGPQNRRALIAAAREIYADGDRNAPFSAVAKRAGVGQGSLYRHFPNPTALAVAVFDENLADLEEYTLPEDRTIENLFDRVVEQAVVSTAFIELISVDLHDPSVAPLGTRFRELVARLLERERELGHVGSHVEIDDVLLATGMLATELARTAPPQQPEVARRARALFRAAFAPRRIDSAGS